MGRQDVSIPTPDGEARAFVFTPDQGAGPWPTAILFMDGPAIRPALFEMAERLAASGYYVLLPDLFWRLGPYEPVNVREAMKDDESRRATFGRLMGSTNPEKAMRDTAAFIAWLDRQPKAKADRIGVTGYCMGGGMALRAAAAFPDRIAVAASFHGGNLATDAPDSPHLGASRIKAKVLVAGGDHDHGFDGAQKDRLAQALAEAGVDAEVSIWKGALHGWVPSDMPVYNPQAAERHWLELVALFDGVLK
jgi:carboxymethylenebutenolidase